MPNMFSKCALRQATLGALALAFAACGSDGATSNPTGTMPAPAAGGAATVAVPAAGTSPTPAPAGAGSSAPAAAGSGVTAPAAGVSAAGASAAGTPAAAGGAGTAAPPATAGTGAGTAAAGTAAPEAPPAACNPADKLPDAKVVALNSITGSSNSSAIVPAKGPLMPVIEHDPGLDTHTVYRPMQLEDNKKYPIVVWANGGCIKNGTMFSRFLLEITSHGFVVVADGKPNGSGMGPLDTNGEPQKQALDWIVAENDRPCSKFYRKLDTEKIAAMGQSCGGLMTMGVSGDKRLTTVMIWNSGMFERDAMIYMGLHTPMAYIIGGPDDVAYPQAEDDFEAINTVPLFYGNTPVGHGGTYSQDNGGEFAQVGIAWLKWQLYGDTTPTAGGMFKGADCGLCKNSKWTVRKKMLD